MTIYDLLRILVDDSSISGKEAAHELISNLEGIGAFGTSASYASTEGSIHVHVPQLEWENSACARYVERCGTCREQTGGPWWPSELNKYTMKPIGR